MVQIIDWYGDGSVGVVDLALACCAVESGAARWLPTPSGGRSVDDAHPRPTMSLKAWRAETSSEHADVSCDERHPADASGRLVAVVSGTVAVGLANRVTRIIDELRATQPVHVVAFGACACAGGPYWDSATVVPGVSMLTGRVPVRVDGWIPGCPPPPQALCAYLDRLTHREES